MLLSSFRFILNPMIQKKNKIKYEEWQSKVKKIRTNKQVEPRDKVQEKMKKKQGADRPHQKREWKHRKNKEKIRLKLVHIIGLKHVTKTEEFWRTELKTMKRERE